MSTTTIEQEEQRVRMEAQRIAEAIKRAAKESGLTVAELLGTLDKL